MPPGRTRVQVRDAGVSGASSLPTGGLAASLPSGEGLSLSLSLRCPRSRPAHRTAPHLAQVRTWPSPASHWGRAHHRSIEVGVLLVTVVPQLVETLECPVFRWVQVARTSTGPPCEKKKKKKKKTRGGEATGGSKNREVEEKISQRFLSTFLGKKLSYTRRNITRNIRKYRKSFVTLPR